MYIFLSIQLLIHVSSYDFSCMPYNEAKYASTRFLSKTPPARPFETCLGLRKKNKFNWNFYNSFIFIFGLLFLSYVTIFRFISIPWLGFKLELGANVGSPFTGRLIVDIHGCIDMSTTSNLSVIPTIC